VPRIIGLDYGDKTIGVAVSCADMRVAVGVGTIRRERPGALRRSLRELAALAAEYGADEIVLGYPKNMDNTEGERCKKTLLFKELLEKKLSGLTVVLWDERLTTSEVMRVISPGAKKNIDESAAVLILQSYLNFKQSEEIKMNSQEDFNNEENDDSIIKMTDEDGNEIEFELLASRELNGVTYVLVAEVLPEDAADDEESEVLIYKCVPDEEDEDMVSFELIDEEHADCDSVYELFNDDFETLGIDFDDEE